MHIYPVQKGDPMKRTNLFSDSYDHIGYARCLDKTNMSHDQVVFLLDESLQYMEKVLDHFLISSDKLNETRRKGNYRGSRKS